MSYGPLKLSAARGAMKLLAEASNVELFDTFGMTKDEIRLVLGSNPWIAGNRQVVRKCLDNLCAGVMDTVGVARFEMPAEYVAAVIAGFVHPTNIMIACRWMETQRPIASLWGSNSTEADVNPATVFALVCSLLDDAGCADLHQTFEKKVGNAINKSKEPKP